MMGYLVQNTDLRWLGRGRVCVCVLQRFLDLTSEVVLLKNNKILQNKVWNYLSCVTLPATSVSLRTNFGDSHCS
jgi:hypothetical protein